MPTRPDPRVVLCELVQMMYAHHLTDTAGGNLSIRQEGKIYITPRYMGSKFRFKIQPEQFSVLDAQTKAVVDGPQELSRESKAHLAIYDAFPEAGAVIHAHPQFVQVFSGNNCPLPATMEYTTKFGETPCIPPTKAHSQALAEAIVESFREREAGFATHGLAVILPYHGIFVMGHDIDEAYDMLERLDVNARVVILGALLKKG
jgi:L-fuculose-phosphate aldolase